MLEKAEEKKDFKPDLYEIFKVNCQSENQKSAIKILKRFTNHEKKLANCLMIILELNLKLDTKQNMEKGSKY